MSRKLRRAQKKQKRAAGTAAGARALLEEGERHLREGRHDEAEKFCRDVLAENPKHSGALFQLILFVKKSMVLKWKWINISIAVLDDVLHGKFHVFPHNPLHILGKGSSTITVWQLLQLRVVKFLHG